MVTHQLPLDEKEIQMLWCQPCKRCLSLRAIKRLTREGPCTSGTIRVSAQKLKAIQDMCEDNQEMNAMNESYLSPLWSKFHSNGGRAMREDIGTSSKTIIESISSINNGVKATNEYIQCLLGRGIEGLIICDKGCRLQVEL